MSEVKMKMHEQTASICKNLKPFTKEEMKLNLKDLTQYLHENSQTKYFMLLSNKINYYTIFVKSNNLLQNEHMAKTILDFLNNDSFLNELGEMKVFKRTDGNEIEIWLGETYFLLFPADSFFIEM